MPRCCRLHTSGHLTEGDLSFVVLLVEDCPDVPPNRSPMLLSQP